MIGKILGGRYEILEEIGKGGMAVVYKARCRLLNRIVAVKVLRDDLDGSEEFIKRFNVEAQAAASLTHPNIVSVYDVGTEGNRHYIVMEYVEGVTLKRYIEQRKVIPWRDAVKITLAILSGLAAAHKKHIVHRDIKPHNIIVTSTGAIKVTDFGIARATTSATVTADDDVLGSVHYFSPEQARGGYVDEKSDIYSLGVVMYEMLCGHVPFDGDTPVAIAMKHLEETPQSLCAQNDKIPASVESVVFKAMSKDTHQRYQTVEEMAADLRQIMSDPSHMAVVENAADTGQTRKIPPVRREVTLDMRDGKYYMADNSKQPEGSESHSRNSIKQKTSKSDKKTIIFAVVTSVLIVAILSTVAIYLLGVGDSTETILVPSVVGMTLEEARELAQEDGFTIEIASYRESDEEDGTILEQDPKEKQVLNAAGTIKVVVSGTGGEEEITLKEYKNKRFRDVKVELENDEIVVVEQPEASSVVSEGYIIRQDPKAGTKVKKGDTVTLYVSSGPDQTQKQVQVPNLMGKTESEAKRALEEKNLSLGSVNYAPSDKEKGTVISQGLTGYVDEKTEVSIILSSGNATEEEPEDEPDEPQNGENSGNNTTGGSTNGGNSSGNNNGQQPSNPTDVQKTKTLALDLSAYNKTVKIDIVANGKTVYSVTQDASKDKDFSAAVNGTGVVNFDIYVDGAKVGSRSIDFNN